MKNSLKLFTISLIMLAVACGGGSNSMEAKKKSLADLKKQALDINAKIASIEKEIGGADNVKSVLVTVTPVVNQEFTHYIELQGKIESESVSYITPRAGGGQVRQLYVKRGDLVKKGQLILQLDNSLIKQSAAAVAQNIETLKAQAALAKSVYEKQKNLWEQNIGSEIQLMTAKTNAEASASQLKSATEQLGMAKDQLAYTSVYSDVDGVAEEVNVKVGEFFQGPGQIKVVNTEHLKITAQVPENYAGKVKVGTDVSRIFFIETKLPVDKSFRPNQLAQVKIKDYAKANAISISLNLLQNDDKNKFIYVAATENGKLIARKKVITVGEFYGNNIEVLSGLAAGDNIITEGYQSLYDGQSITTTQK